MPSNPEQIPRAPFTHLQRGTCQNQAISARIVLRQSLRELAVGVLHTVTFVDDHVDPFVLCEERSVLNDVLVGREEDLERVPLDLVLQTLPDWGRPLVDHHFDARGPLGKLQRPVAERRQRDDA